MIDSVTEYMPNNPEILTTSPDFVAEQAQVPRAEDLGHEEQIAVSTDELADQARKLASEVHAAEVPQSNEVTSYHLQRVVQMGRNIDAYRNNALLN